MANPRGQQRDKPFRDAIRMEAAALANGELIAHPRGSLRSIAQAMLLKGSDGDVPAGKEIGDRLDGKPAQAVEMSGGLAVSHEEALDQLDDKGTGNPPQA
jgi:hypothetical protein